MNVGVFTTIKVKNGIPLFWEKHNQRLIANAQKVKVGKFTVSVHEIKNYLIKNTVRDCTVKIIITTVREKTTVMFEHRLLPQNSQQYKLITYPDTRNYLKIYKITDRRIHDLAEQTAKEKGANGALFIFNGTIIESTIGNIFSLNKKGEIITPPIHARGLNGITRQLLTGVTNVRELDIHENTNGPLVLVNALRIQKITHLNGKKLLDGSKLALILKKLLDTQEEIYLNQHLPH